MTTLLEVCDDNVLRAGAIRGVVAQIVSEERRPTTAEVDSICARLPNFGTVLQVEVDAAMAEIEAAAEAHAASLEQPAGNDAEMNTAPNAESEPSAAVGEEMSVPTLDRDAAIERLRLLQITLADARAAVMKLTTLRNAQRGRVADALQAWVSGMPKLSRTEAAKQAIRTFQADKQRLADAGLPPTAKHVPNSYFDRVGSYGHGDATTFLRKQMRRGGKRFTTGDVMMRDGRIGKPPSEQ